jgi:hypothetical protein
MACTYISKSSYCWHFYLLNDGKRLVGFSKHGDAVAVASLAKLDIDGFVIEPVGLDVPLVTGLGINLDNPDKPPELDSIDSPAAPAASPVPPDPVLGL